MQITKRLKRVSPGWIEVFESITRRNQEVFNKKSPRDMDPGAFRTQFVALTAGVAADLRWDQSR